MNIGKNDIRQMCFDLKIVERQTSLDDRTLFFYVCCCCSSCEKYFIQGEKLLKYKVLINCLPCDLQFSGVFFYRN